jgi:hypothetical protein
LLKANKWCLQENSVANHLTQSSWDLNYDLVEGGLVIQAVKHDGFRLAHDVRVTRLWVDAEWPASTSSKNLRNFKLNSADLPATTATVTVLKQPSNPDPAFKGYATPFGLEASFSSKNKYLAGTPNECDITVTERFLFATYGKNPAHEPGGVLDATRLFPLLEFSFPAVDPKNVSQPYPKYFRADYRLDIDIDNVDEAGVVARSLAGSTTENKAAIFRDEESAPSKFQTAAAGVLSLGVSAVNAEPLFAAIEKPLQYEVASYGLVKGSPPAGIDDSKTWDNAHIWPAKKGSYIDPISTPGAFHAVHCHWRWGAVSGDPQARGSLIPAAGAPQFQGVGWSASAGGALVDSKIPTQNLQFAISKADEPAWAAANNPSKQDFKTLFTDARTDPDEVKNGGDLVLWLSFEVFRQDTKPWQGTLFVNGLYFAHNKDNTPLLVRLAGAYGTGAKPSPSKQWQRFAK